MVVFLSIILGCDVSETVVISVPRHLPEIAAGGRLVVEEQRRPAHRGSHGDIE